jgi:hypothetical protein
MAGTSRNLVVLSDGTGNSAATPFKTNVWRLYQALDLTNGSQVAVFGDGVGTSSIKILRVLGLALGIGVKRNVLELYKFLCRNYKAGDRIWAFGFSRGAFTIRVLVGLIHRQGLVAFSTEEELQRNALAAYRAYRQEAFGTVIPWVWAGRLARDGLVSLWRYMTGADSHDKVRKETIKQGRDKIDVHFVGVWDTVVAYGLPIDELTIAVDKWVWPMKFRDSSLLPNVHHARHALSIDDERRTFFPIPWDETARLPPDRLLQVWFPGVHADVGGGYPDDGLALVPLCWMIDEAAAKGLKFEPPIVETYNAIAAPTGRLYDSRAGAGAFWRYQPRDAQVLMGASVRPLVHWSVVTRMTYGNDGYAPISLPNVIDVLLPDGSRVAFDDAEIQKAARRTTGDIAKANAATAPAAPGQNGEPALRNLRRQQTLLADLSDLVKSAPSAVRADLVALVLDTVWWRRLVYFVTLFLALAVGALPLLKEYLDFDGRTGRLNDIAGGQFSWLLGFIRGFVPGFAAPWLDAIVENPVAAVLVIGALILSLGLSAFLQRRICDRARAAWSERVQAGRAKVNRLKMTGQRHALAKSTIVFLLLTIITWTPPSPPWLPKAFGAIFVLSLVLWIFRMIRPAGNINPSSPGWLLMLARKARTSPGTVATYRYVAQTLAPIFFILCAAMLVLALVHRAVFDVQSAVGAYCSATKRVTALSQAEKQAAARDENVGSATFKTGDFCAATGLRLVAGRRYRITLETQEDWFDKSIRTDVGGFAARGVHYAASPLKRWWRENWFQPVARIGEVGNYEHVLTPAAPLPAVDFDPCKDAIPLPSLPFWEALKDAQAPAPAAYREAHLACEQRENIRGSKLLVSDITAGATGELFIYVNDAVLAVPRTFDFFYRNNSGTANVTVTRILAPLAIDSDRAASPEPTAGSPRK